MSSICQKLISKSVLWPFLFSVKSSEYEYKYVFSFSHSNYTRGVNDVRKNQNRMGTQLLGSFILFQ